MNLQIRWALKKIWECTYLSRMYMQITLIETLVLPQFYEILNEKQKIKQVRKKYKAFYMYTFQMHHVLNRQI